eukprot:TRINITY_DN4386_c3_g1_i1.p1 TRINITY_DN4386_c3_g1~~TRINITY_DN4386_c3_g1_i1.p1  ORF type:complete len:504 (+),score=139.09 TRINITY_DN4386_c3_g1_i1:77-1588(+)
MSVAALAALCNKGQPPLSRLQQLCPQALVLIASYAGPRYAELCSVVGRGVRVRLCGVPHEGYAATLDLWGRVVTVPLATGQVVEVPCGNDDLSETAVPGAPDEHPHVLGQITPQWLSKALAGPKYQPSVHSFERHLVNQSLVCRKSDKQRLHYFTEGETKLRPRGRPKFVFVKLNTHYPGHSLHESAGDKREVYMYTHLLHEYPVQVAPLCLHASYCDSARSLSLLLEDLAPWRPAPQELSAEDAALAAGGLALVHAQYWGNPAQRLRRHFVEDISSEGAVAARCRDLLPSLDQLLGSIRERCPDDPFVRSALAPGSPAIHQLKQLCSVSDTLVEAGYAAAAAFSLCHLNLRPEHIFFHPAPNAPSRCVFVDWRYCDRAPVGFDLALLIGNCLADDAPLDPVFDAYLAALGEAGVEDPPPAAAIRSSADRFMVVALLLALNEQAEFLRRPQTWPLPSQKRHAADAARGFATASLRLIRRCAALAPNAPWGRESTRLGGDCIEE